MLLVVIVVFGLGGVGYVLSSNTNELQTAVETKSTPSQTSTEQSRPVVKKVETVTVAYTDNGFSPQSIKIVKGSTVNFVNKSSIPLWVASDPHPEHTNYPEFDVIYDRDEYPGMGEDFSFTFEKEGTWEYHSHTASGDATDTGIHPGVIIVELIL